MKKGSHPYRMTPFCVLVKGFEPPRFPRLILSQMRMPFRHTSKNNMDYTIMRNALQAKVA